MKREDQEAVSRIDLTARKALADYVEERKLAEGWWDTPRAERLKALTIGQLLEGLSNANTPADLANAQALLGQHFTIVLDGLRTLNPEIKMGDFITSTH